MDRRPVEIVERKGLRHPDTICDRALDAVSVALCGAYRKCFGAILHHNCDKGLLAAGRVEHRLGGGSVLAPMRLVLGDRASWGPQLPEREVAAVAVEAARSWIREHLAHVDPERHIVYQVELRSGSSQLVGAFPVAGDESPRANDTSAAVGYAPLSETERLVLGAEAFLNSAELKRRSPPTGEDVKVMGIRSGRNLDLTVAMPFLDAGLSSESQYFDARAGVVDALRSYLESQLESVDQLTVTLNALDRRGAGLSGMYLTVVGTSAEDADSGEVGRGNRVNGLIPLFRPGGTEAAAGKNPVSHVGKIYNVLTHLLAARIHTEVPGLEEVIVWLCSRIGDTVDAPRTIVLGLRPARGVSLQDARGPAERLVAEELARLPLLREELAAGRHQLS